MQQSDSKLSELRYIEKKGGTAGAAAGKRASGPSGFAGRP